MRQISSMRLMCLVVFGVVLAAMWTGCAPDVKDLRAEGIQQFREHQYVESLATLRYALKQNPNDAQSNYYMGLNYRALAERRLREGDIPAGKRTLDMSIIYFTQAVKSWPNYMAAVQAKTEALEVRGKYDSALTVAEDVASNNRGVAEHFVFLGDEYRARADFDEALRAYKTALATDPKNARAYAGIGKTYLRAGDRTMAAEAFAKAHELNPAETDAVEAFAELQNETHSTEASPSPPPVAPPAPTESGARIYTGH